MSDDNNTPDNNAASSGDGAGLSLKKQAFARAYHQEPNATQAEHRIGLVSALHRRQNLLVMFIGAAIALRSAGRCQAAMLTSV